jgi:hypothetical protein
VERGFDRRDFIELMRVGFGQRFPGIAAWQRASEGIGSATVEC